MKIIEEDGMHASISHEDDYAVATVTLETTVEIYYWMLIFYNFCLK